MVSLAQLLRPQVASMSGQHLANCLLSLSRLSLCHEPLALLQLSLQARLLRKDFAFSAQQLANCFHALATVHGEAAPAQRYSAPLPGTLLPTLVELVLKLGLAIVSQEHMQVDMARSSRLAWLFKLSRPQRHPGQLCLHPFWHSMALLAGRR